MHPQPSSRCPHPRVQRPCSRAKVLNNKDYIAAVRSTLGNAAATVDMESYGFLSTIHKLRRDTARNLSSKQTRENNVKPD